MPRSPSLDVIRTQIRELEKQAKKIESKLDKGIAEAAELIARHGLSLADWKRAVALGNSKKKRSAGKAAPRKGKSKAKGKAHKRVPVKYADDKGNTWSGRGRSPLWLVAAEKNGRKREAFLVKGKGQDRASLH
jgi:DNA-binding protein H-NS